MKEIKKYKGVSLKYCESDGLIYFNFENQERKTKYVFEAERIIDEPVWRDCVLEGYFVDGYSDKYIGLAKAIRKNIKTGKPDWLFKRQYDLKYEKRNNFDMVKVFLKNKYNDDVYNQWKEQREIYLKELRKLNATVSLLKD